MAEKFTRLPDMDRFEGLVLEPPSTIAIQYLTAPARDRTAGRCEFRCTTEQAYRMYLHLAQVFYDLGHKQWPPAEPHKTGR